MPLYEYECDDCRGRFERIQKFSDPLVETCPTCGGATHKLPSSPAIQFKGTGWYVTDYAKKPSPGQGDGESQGSKDADSKSSASSSDSSSKETKSSSKTAESGKSSASSSSSSSDAPK